MPDEKTTVSIPGDNPPVFQDAPPSCLFKNPLYAFSFSQRGSSHKAIQLPCQDSCAMRMLENSPILIMADADGVGSCSRSEIGSQAAVDAAVQYIAENLEPFAAADDFVFTDDARMRTLMNEAMESACEAVEKKADELKLPVSELYSTLTVSIYDGETLYFAHAGDDGIVVLLDDGTFSMVTSRHSGAEAHSLYPLQARNWDLSRVTGKVCAFAQMTDGVLDEFVGSTRFRNRVFDPFFADLFLPGVDSISDVDAQSAYFFSLFQSDSLRSRIHDDITLMSAVNPRALAGVTLRAFDLKAWILQTEEINRQDTATLYQHEESEVTPAHETPAAPVPSPDEADPVHPGEPDVHIPEVLSESEVPPIRKNPTLRFSVGIDYHPRPHAPAPLSVEDLVNQARFYARYMLNVSAETRSVIRHCAGKIEHTVRDFTHSL